MQDRTENSPEAKVCESCGETFGCGAKLEGCWCVDVAMPPAAAADLNATFKDCLCPKCLASIAKTKLTK